MTNEFQIELAEELYHHGIEGQKWGKRNGPPYPLTASRLSKAEKKQEKIEKKDRKKASRNRRNLSDKEIQDRINRLQMEKKLKDLTNEDLKPGKSAVKNILKNSGSKVLGTMATGALLYTGKLYLSNGGHITPEMLKDLGNLKEAAGYIFPKPKNK